MKPKSSCIWNYFNEVNSNSAKCKLCMKTYSRKGGTTTSLKSHLKSVHATEYEEFIKSETEKKRYYTWTEPSSNVSLLSLTAHGINRDFKRLKFILKCHTFDGRHTGDLVLEKINSMLMEWGIIKEKIYCFVRDSGSNMIRAMKLGDLPDVSCTVHQLQLCVRTLLDSDEEIKALLSKRKKFSTLNHSQIAQTEEKIETEIMSLFDADTFKNEADNIGAPVEKRARMELPAEASHSNVQTVLSNILFSDSDEDDDDTTSGRCIFDKFVDRLSSDLLKLPKSEYEDIDNPEYQ
ncbi:uncharacterized protein LOC112046345 [Bicyclus anynana]|uniref:Uncharacterized protein LOC112046345 n=1 Tax=Bicyclus anynana TaxID=110368 RepID=A0ABM3LZL2_BICAN|nr:uncharacterized protein LOC112046345 [Bicyclus anynana]